MASTNISSLKNDILFELFALVAATDPPYALPWMDPGPLKYHLGWIRLSHVCRLWRTLLVDEMPSLWAGAVCQLPHAFDALLSRAQDQPLILTTAIDLPSGRGSELLARALEDRLRELCVAHVARARSLISDDGPKDWATPLSGKHLPLLKKINIHQHQAHGDQPVATLFPLDAPNLKAVFIREIAVTFTSRSIRALTLHGHSIFSHEQWPLMDVFKSLHASLEFLELEMRPPKAIDWRAQATSPVALENLKHLHLYGSAIADLPQLVNLLDVPTILEEHTYYNHLQLVGWERFVNAFGHILRQPSFNALYLMDDGNVFASTFTPFVKPEQYPTNEMQEASLEVGYKHMGVNGDDDAKAITLAMLKHLDYARMEQIVLQVGSDEGTDRKIDDLRGALRPFEAVTSFAAFSHDALKVLSAGDDALGPVFPTLSLLVATMEPKYREEEQWNAERLRAWWDTLCDVLEDRVRAGVSIPRVRLTSNATPIAATDELREVERDALARLKELVPILEDTRKVFEESQDKSV